MTVDEVRAVPSGSLRSPSGTRPPAADAPAGSPEDGQPHAAPARLPAGSLPALRPAARPPDDWQLPPADAEALGELWAEAAARGWRADFDSVEPDWSLLGPADETVEYVPPGDISTGTLWIHADGSPFGSTLRATDIATHRVAAGLVRLFLGWQA